MDKVELTEKYLRNNSQLWCDSVHEQMSRSGDQNRWFEIWLMLSRYNPEYQELAEKYYKRMEALGELNAKSRI